MTLYINRPEAEFILDLISGGATPSQHKAHAGALSAQLLDRLGKTESKKEGWAPMGRIRPSWPSNFIKPSRKSGSRKPRDKKPEKEKPQPMTAEQILAGLAL